MYLLAKKLGLADQVAGKARMISGRPVADAVAKGEVEIGFQQISELLPVPGIAHITPLPQEVQKVSTFSAGVARTTTDAAAARAVLRFLSSAAAAPAISKSGLEPIETV